jgi:drug/metabolite transporter (DMT)-like permease
MYANTPTIARAARTIASNGVKERRAAGGGGPPSSGRDCVLAEDFLPITLSLPCLCSGATVDGWCGGPADRDAVSALRNRRGTVLRMSAGNRRAYLAWVAVCLIWGTTYLGIRIALETIPPLLMAAIRWIVAGGLLVTVLTLRGVRMPQRGEWPALAVLGILLLGFGNGAVVWAEQTVPSGLTAVLVATSPFWMVGIDALMPDGERLTLRRLLGLVVGFCGIVMLVWPEIHVGEGGRTFLGGVISAQIACIGWAVGSSYARSRGRGHAKDENVLASAAFEMLFGGVALLAVSLVLREPAGLAFSPRSATALLYLTFVGAIAGFSAYAYALKHLPVATVSLYAYVNPIIAVVLGTLVLREPFNARMAVAAAVVLVGIGLVRQRGDG